MMGVLVVCVFCVDGMAGHPLRAALRWLASPSLREMDGLVSWV